MTTRIWERVQLLDTGAANVWLENAAGKPVSDVVHVYPARTKQEALVLAAGKGLAVRS